MGALSNNAPWPGVRPKVSHCPGCQSTREVDRGANVQPNSYTKKIM
jgi:hypothetical protein